MGVPLYAPRPFVHIAPLEILLQLLINYFFSVAQYVFCNTVCCLFFSNTRCLFLQSYSTGANADLLPPLPPSSRAAHAPHPPHHHHHHHHHHHRSNLSVCVLPPAMVQRSVLLWCLVWCSLNTVLFCLYMYVLRSMFVCVVLLSLTVQTSKNVTHFYQYVQVFL